MKTIRFILISFLVFSVLSSCKNFLNGDDLLNELNEVIADANAPEVQIYISADADTGTVTPSGNVSCKVGRKFPVIFNESKGYQFLYWEVIDRNTKQPLQNVLGIDKENESEIEVKVNKNDSNICLHPVCAERLQVSARSPENSAEGVSRDSSISITFNHELADDNDLTRISIYADGVLVNDNFKAPVKNNEVVTIPANLSNLIPLNTPTRAIKIVIPQDFYYLKNEQKIYLGSEYSWNYNINGSSNNKAEINVSVAQEKGKVTPSETKTYNIGDVIKLKFEPNIGYDFSGWNILDSEGNPVDSSILKVDDINSIETTITVLDKILGVTITPKTWLVPAVTKVTPEAISTGVNCTSQIQIIFNKPVSVAAISKASIQLIDSFNRDLSEYFDEPVPVLDKDSNTTCSSVLINVNRNKTNELMSLVTSSYSFLDVNVIISKNITDADGVCMEDDYVHSYRINDSAEKIKPVINSISLARTKNELNDSKKELVNTNYNEWTGANEVNYSRNHVKSVWIDCKATDVGSFVSNLFVKETILFDNDKSPLNITKETEIPYNGNEPVEYNFKNLNDGLVLLEIYAKDFFGNVSEESKKYYVVKDTFIKSASVKVFRYGGDNWFNDNEFTNLNEINRYVKRVYWYGSDDDDEWFDGRKTEAKTYTYSIKYSYDENFKDYQTLDYSFDNNIICPDENKGAHYFDFPDNLDESKTVYFSISVYDEALNETRITSYIYAKPVVTDYSFEDDKIWLTIDNALDGENSGVGYYLYYKRINKQTKDEEGFYHTSLSLRGSTMYYISGLDNATYDYEFYIQAKHSYSYHPEWGQTKTDDPRCIEAGFISEPIYNKMYENGMDSSLIPVVSKAEITIMEKNTASYKFAIEMDKTLYEKYDSVKIEYGKDGITYSYLGELTNSKQDFILPYKVVLPFNKNTQRNELTDELPIKKIKIKAFKGNEKYENVIDVPKYSISDNVPPVIMNNINIVSSKMGNLFLMTDGAHDYFFTDEISNIEDNVNVYIINCKKEWEFVTLVNNINISEEEIKNTAIYKTTINHKKSYVQPQMGDYNKRYLWNIEIPSDLIAGRYLICLSAKDTAGNEAFKPIGFYNRAVLNTKPEVTVNTKPTISYKITSQDINDTQKYSCSIEAEYFDTSDGKWKHLKESDNNYYYYYGNPDSKGNNTNFSVVLSNFTINNFVRVYLSEVVLLNLTGDDKVLVDLYYPINYTKPLYFLNSESKSNDGYVTEDFTGKFWSNAKQNCLFSTVYSKENLGDDADIWEMYTKDEQHLNTQIVSPGQSYEPDYNHVPENCYYTVIVHYSDGKTEMLPVKQK